MDFPTSNFWYVQLWVFVCVDKHAVYKYIILSVTFLLKYFFKVLFHNLGFYLGLFIYVLEIFYSIFGLSHFSLEWDLLLFALTWVRLVNCHLFGAKLKEFLMAGFL